LEGVFGIVFVAGDGAAGPQDHHAVAIDQHREGKLGRIAGTVAEAFEELAVGQAGEAPCMEQGAEMSQGDAVSLGCHRMAPSALVGLSHQ
jgi:hypothetical protein